MHLTMKVELTDQELKDLRLACEFLAGDYHFNLKARIEADCGPDGYRHKRICALSRKINRAWQQSFWKTLNPGPT